MVFQNAITGAASLARQIAEGRYQRYAQRFGELLVKAAAPHAIDSAEVVYDLWEDKFYCYLKGAQAPIPLRFDATIVTDPLERGDREGLVNAERRVQFGVDEAFRTFAVADNGSSGGRA
jgi:hypothetical protein